MTCKHCLDAEQQDDPTRDPFSAHCRSCKARAIASIGAHMESQEMGAITPHYRSVLERVFGDDWKQGHELVRTWGKRITEASVRQKVRAL